MLDLVPTRAPRQGSECCARYEHLNCAARLEQSESQTCKTLNDISPSTSPQSCLNVLHQRTPTRWRPSTTWATRWVSQRVARARNGRHSHGLGQSSMSNEFVLACCAAKREHEGSTRRAQHNQCTAQLATTCELSSDQHSQGSRFIM